MLQFLEQRQAAGLRGPLRQCPAGQAPAGFSRLMLDQSQIPSAKAGAASLLLLCPGLNQGLGQGLQDPKGAVWGQGIHPGGAYCL